MPKPIPLQGQGLDLVGMWPDLFVGMTEDDADAVIEAFVSIWHEGWEPNRGDVEALIARRRGTLTHEDYLARAWANSKGSGPESQPSHRFEPYYPRVLPAPEDTEAHDAHIESRAAKNQDAAAKGVDMTERKLTLQEIGERASRDFEAMPKPIPLQEQGLDLVGMWPDLFVGMTEKEASLITGAFIANWHDGWEPNRGDVEALIARRRGTLTNEDYLARAWATNKDSESESQPRHRFEPYYPRVSPAPEGTGT